MSLPYSLVLLSPFLVFVSIATSGRVPTPRLAQESLLILCLYLFLIFFDIFSYFFYSILLFLPLPAFCYLTCIVCLTVSSSLTCPFFEIWSWCEPKSTAFGSWFAAPFATKGCHSNGCVKCDHTTGDEAGSRDSSSKPGWNSGALAMLWQRCFLVSCC